MLRFRSCSGVEYNQNFTFINAFYEPVYLHEKEYVRKNKIGAYKG